MKSYFFSFCLVMSCFSFATPPANDSFSHRQIITGTSGVVTGTTADATLEQGEPRHAYNLNISGTNSVWYSWTAPSTATYCFNLDGELLNIVCVYTGSNITNLQKIIYYSGGVTFDAENGTTYQIAVINYNRTITGKFVLTYCKTDISPWTDIISDTNGLIFGVSARNGSLAYYYLNYIYSARRRTNCLGGIADMDLRFLFLPKTGVSVIDKNGNKIIDNVTPEGMGDNYAIHTFDGKTLVAYNQQNSKLIAYKVKNNFSVINEQNVDDVWEAEICGSKIYAYRLVFGLPYGGFKTGVNVYDKKLKRLIYSLPFEAKTIRTQNIYKGIFTRMAEDNYFLNISSTKNGKKISDFNIPFPETGEVSYCNDAKGGLLYWARARNGTDYINGNLTYIDKKGKIILQDFALPDVGATWEYVEESMKNLFIAVDNGVSHKIISYKINKNLKKVGETDISNYNHMRFDGKNLMIYQFLTDQEGVTSCNSKMKRQWSDPIGNGDVFSLRKDTFVREIIQPQGAQTNFIFKIFNKKKTIAEHSIIY